MGEIRDRSLPSFKVGPFSYRKLRGVKQAGNFWYRGHSCGLSNLPNWMFRERGGSAMSLPMQLCGGAHPLKIH